ncbi:MAG: SCO family protein [Gammaproteobacteria bacterium]
MASFPPLVAGTNVSATAKRRRPWTMPVLIGAAAVVPILVSLLLYFQPAWFALGHSNHGRLLRPPVKIKTAPLARLFAASPLPADYFRGRWTMVYVGVPYCGAVCREALYVTRQIRLGMGQDITRVQRLYVVRGDRVDAPRKLRSAHPDLTVAEAPGTAGQQFAAQFTAIAGQNSIYLVDPQGLLMMTYPVKAKPLGLLQDLRHLLKVNSP